MNPEHKHDHLHRTGAWLFASIALLDDLDKQYDTIDDLEAFFWVLLYTTSHRFNTDHKRNMTLIFTWTTDEYHNGKPTGRFLGGVYKTSALGCLCWWIDFGCRPLGELIMDLLAEPLGDYNRALIHYQGCEASLKRHPTDIKLIRKSEDSRKKLDELYAEVGDPSWWIEIFNTALGMDGWIDDAVMDVPHSPRTTQTDQYINSDVDQPLVVLQTSPEDTGIGGSVDFSPVSNSIGGEELLHLVTLLSSYVLGAHPHRSSKSRSRDSVDRTAMVTDALERPRKRRRIRMTDEPPIPALSLPEVAFMESQDGTSTDNPNNLGNDICVSHDI